MSKGRDAKVGSRSLCLHRKFSTSSANPRKIMQQMARSAPISCTNCTNGTKMVSRILKFKDNCWMVVVNGTLVDKPRHEGSPYTGFLQSSSGKALEWSRRGWWGRLSHWLHPGTPGCKKIYRNMVRLNPTTEQQLTALSRATHISFLVVLFRSIPYNLAEMKWSLNAGMSFSVARQPSAESRPFITSGRTGTADMFSGFCGEVCVRQIKSRF